MATLLTSFRHLVLVPATGLRSPVAVAGMAPVAVMVRAAETILIPGALATILIRQGTGTALETILIRQVMETVPVTIQIRVAAPAEVDRAIPLKRRPVSEFRMGATTDCVSA